MNWGFKREWARDVRPGGPMGSMHDVSAEVALTRITDRAITCGTYRVTPARARRILGVGPLLLAMLAGFHTKGFAAQGPTPAVSAPMSDTLHDVPNFVHLIARVKPAVVSVTSRVKLSNATRNGQTLGSRQSAPPFNRPSLREKAPRELMAETRGCGFIIQPDGVIIASSRLVENAVSVSVTLDDGRRFSARVLGHDPLTDIAVLKIATARPLPYVVLGDSSRVQTGQWVVMIGSPLGLSGSATAGVVSAEDRDIGAYNQFIQFDASLNEGDAGGPLFTQSGKVIGMTTAIISPSGVWNGIGLAVPSNVISTIAPQLATNGHVIRGFLGVQAQSISPVLARALHLPDTAGALIAGLEPDGPAARAGLEVGDVIRAVAGRTTAKPRDVAVAVANMRPGDQAQIRVVHDGHSQTITVRVAAAPEPPRHVGVTANQPHEAGLGLTLGSLSATRRAQLNVPAGIDGALVLDVQPGSPAANAGIRPGDVIAGVGTTAVSDPADAARALRHAEEGSGDVLLLRVVRKGRALFVAVEGLSSDKG